MEIGHLDGDKTWVTDNDVDDPKSLPDLATYHVLVRPVKVETKAGSILLPDSFKDDVQFLTNVGRIVKLGPTAFMHTDGHNPTTNPHGKFGCNFAQEGDFVVWGKNRGTKVKIKGVSFVVLTDEELIMKVDNPQDINPMDNLLATTTYRK